MARRSFSGTPPLPASPGQERFMGGPAPLYEFQIRISREIFQLPAEARAGIFRWRIWRLRFSAVARSATEIPCK